MLPVETDTDQRWDSLLRYIDDGKVVPIVGRDLLWLERGGRQTFVPRLLAEQLAERLRVSVPADIGGDPVDAVVRAYYLRPDHEHERPYAELSALVRAIDSEPVPAALVKLAELPFSRFVSTTCDDFLLRAVRGAQVDGESVTAVVNSLGAAQDIPKLDNPGERIVVQLLGRANPTTDYAITDADVLEFVHQFQRTNQPEQLLNTIRKQHILVIGGGFSDWLTRLLLRLVRTERLWINRGLRHFFADPEATRDLKLRSFLEHPLTTAAVFQTDNTTEFVNELHRRWTARGMTRQARLRQHTVQATGPQSTTGRVFLSYASEDLAAAQRVNALLTEANIDVWFDKTGFTPGDDWDRIIRTRIESSYLFVPLISPHTEAPDGYFYKEWRWAEERANRLAYGIKFAFPVLVVGDWKPNPLRLPDLFTKAQHSVAAGGELSVHFVRELRSAYRAFQAVRA